MNTAVRLFGHIGSASALLSGSVSFAEEGAAPNLVPAVLMLESRSTGDPDMIRRSATLGSPRAWAKPTDYPEAALIEPRQGQVHVDVDVTVGKDDRIVSCAPVPYSRGNSPVFEKQACLLVYKYGTFLHALDVSGTAREGVVPMVVTFSLREAGEREYSPGPSPPPSGFNGMARGPEIRDPNDLILHEVRSDFVPRGEVGAWIDVNARGRVTRCRIRNTSGTDVGDAAACRQIKRARFNPARDRAGNTMAVPGSFITMKAPG